MQSGRFLVKMGIAGVALLACFWCFGWLMRPALPVGITQPSAESVRVAAEARNDALPLDKPLRIWRDVDYGKAEKAAWRNDWATFKEPETGEPLGSIPELVKIKGEYGRIEKVDDHTVRYVFPHPYGMFPEYMATI